MKQQIGPKSDSFLLELMMIHSHLFTQAKIIPRFISLWKLASVGGRKTNHFNICPGVLVFISMLSLRGGQEGGAHRRHCAADRIGFVCDEWGCHRRWQVCVQYMWMYNTLCILWQAGRLFVPIISISFRLRLLMAAAVTEGCAMDAAHRRSILWKQNGTPSWLMCLSVYNVCPPPFFHFSVLKVTETVKEKKTRKCSGSAPEGLKTLDTETVQGLLRTECRSEKNLEFLQDSFQG